MKRGVIYASILICLLSLGWCARHKADRRADEQVRSETLPPTDRAKIILDEKRHTITTVARQPSGHGQSYSPEPTVRTVHLSPHAAVEVLNDGSVKVDSRQWGTEIEPFFGMGYADVTRAHLGLSLLYYKNFDLNVSAAVRLDITHSENVVKPVISGSYNFYSNTSVFLGMNPTVFPKVELHGGLMWRF